jgi:signal transduction histidine kinase
MKNKLLLIALLTFFATTLLCATIVDKPTVLSISDSNLYQSNRSDTPFKDLNGSIKLLKTREKLSTKNIAYHAKRFVSLPLTETFQDEHYDYWLRVDIGSHFPNGHFICHYGDPVIIADTFLPTQHHEYFHFQGINYLRFDYHASRDPHIYYFKLQPKHFRQSFRFIQIHSVKGFYTSIMSQFRMQLLIGLILGLILMAAIYNGAMYYYNREPSLLYYTLMQLFMVAMLYNVTGMELFDEASFLSRNTTYESLVSLGIALFAIRFTLAFLEIEKYMPRLYRIFQLELILVGIDICITPLDRSYLFAWHIYPFLMLPFLYAGFRRMRQGYLPARYYLAGWVLLTLGVFLSLFSSFDLRLDPLYLGATGEAILFSLALSYKLRLQTREKEQQREMLIQQSRLASMGEMLGNIAHQWRQPLNHLGYIFMNLEAAKKHGELDGHYLSKKLSEANSQLTFMSDTIDDFKHFFAPQRQEESFSLIAATQETLEVMRHTLQHHHITIEIDTQVDTTLHTYKNAYKQVLLNLLANAKDTLMERSTPHPKITIRHTDYCCTIEDNAGGIDMEILPHIFEPYFSTKEGGLGIGLYMSKVLIEKNMGGTLKARKIKNGMFFEIILP